MTSAGSDRRAIITEALRKIDDLTKRLAIAEADDVEPIAVIGMGCRLPGGVFDTEDYWDLLTEGRSGVIRVPADRWDADEFFTTDHTEPGTINTTDGGFLTGWSPDEFDAEFFGLTPREAAGMDPQQRLLMEVAWEALEDAGITPTSIRGTQTSVFVGLTTNDYSLLFANKLAPHELDPYIPFGNASNFAAGRLSYFLGLNGPAVVSDTACSSSLVSIHLAVQSLRRRESDTALAAGVNLMLSPENSIACSRWGMLAPDGTCKTFDADANGYIRSEGCGVVILKRLSDAQRDGDRVLAVVRGSGVNQDGASSGQTVPNGPAQQALMRRVLANARLDPSEVDYIEAHGTGTPLGDPIELDALVGVYGDRKDSEPLVLGSVKTNLGHLESASGVTGFIKAVLAVNAAHIPKQLYFKQLNPHASEAASKFTIAAEPMDWPQTGRPRRAAVSGFGVSGTNAHVIIEQAPAAPVAADTPAVPEPAVSTLVVSAKTPERVGTWAAALADWLEGPGDGTPLSAIAHTLDHHRARFSTFATVTAADQAAAVTGLRAVAGGYRAPGVVGAHPGICRPGTVFVYSGQGSQWAGMGQRLLATEPAFAAAIDEIEPDFVAAAGFSLKETLLSGETVVGIDRIQPVLTGIQLALTELWRSYGITPDAVIGHSMGEVAAAVVSGALSRADGLTVISTRSRLMKRLSGQGAMALLGLDAAAAEEAIAAQPDLTIAVYASPGQTVIAGPPEQVDAVIATVAATDRLARRVEVDVASHHPIIDPILPELRTELAGLRPQQPTIPLFSTADPQGGSPLMDADYWCANLRNPVRFSQAVQAAAKEHGTFIESSPHPVLTYALDDALAEVHHHSIGSLYRDTDDAVTFHTNLNATHTLRAPQSEHVHAQMVSLPHTPWHHEHHWVRIPDVELVPTGSVRAGSPAAVAPTRGGHGVLDDWLLELDWPARELPRDLAVAATSWTVIADPAVGPALGTALDRHAYSSVRVLDESVLAGSALDGADLDGVDVVLYAPSVPTATFDPAPAHAAFTAAQRLATALVKLPKPPKLVVLTRNAQPVDAGDRSNPAHAILWGFGRTLALENPEIWHGIIDVDATVPPELIARYVADEVAVHAVTPDADDQVVYRGGSRRVPRLRHAQVPPALTGLPADTSHLVIGATGNVGPDLIRQLAEMGAATVVAVSRTGGRLADLQSELASGGTTLVEVAADAADPVAMGELFARFGADLPPLDGIYLAALSGGAGQLTELGSDDVAAMFRPKVDAVSVCHALSLTTPVRRFVLFSSITGVFGSRWLGHYTAANAFADAFAYARRAIGLPASVIDWGLWKSWADAQPETASAGLTPLPNDVAIGTLPTLLSPDAGVRPILVGADWERLSAAYRMRTAFRVVDGLDGGVDESAFAALAQPTPGTVLGDEAAATGTTRTWRARLVPQELPYPGGHRIQGVDVVPASVLLQTLSTVAGGLDTPSAIGEVRFEYPVVLDRPRAIDVVLTDGVLTVSSSPTPDAPADRWVEHVRAAVAPVSSADLADRAATPPVAATAFDASTAAELQRAWGIEGQPFEWSVRAHTATDGELTAEVALPVDDPANPPTATLIDAAVHLARLANSSNDGLMFPAAVGALQVSGSVAQAASVRVVHRGGDDAGFTVDVIATAADGSVVLTARDLAYAAMESTAAPETATDDTTSAIDTPPWATMTAADTEQTLQTRLQAILARELGMPADAVRLDQPFPELGLDSMMAMSVLRDAKHLVGMDLSATMLWNHPTIAAMSELLTEMLAPLRAEATAGAETEADDVEADDDLGDNLLDSLFDSVESLGAESLSDDGPMTAASESGN